MISGMNKRWIAGIALSLFCLIGLPAQEFTADNQAAMRAREEFRRGVQAYNRFNFNESLRLFETALGYLNDEPLILDWLGKSYFRSGFEDAALRQWNAALNGFGKASPAGISLASRIETVSARRGPFLLVDDQSQYARSGAIPGRSGDIWIFRHPSAVLPLEDASAWVVAYGSNELVRVDVNGVVKTRVRGPINGFDRPYDVARGPDGRLYVSEFKGNRISILDASGAWQRSFGEKGRGPGQLVGPQNMAIDEAGYLYVVDFGNLRVNKYDPEGSFIFSFGNRDELFPGLRTPTGIAVIGGSVFVADAGRRHIARFDTNGEFSALIAQDGLTYPEGLKADGDGRLIVADTDGLLIVDPEGGSVRVLARLGKAGGRIVSAAADLNGNMVLANYSQHEISFMSRVEDLSAGLFVQIERVISDRFPEITVEVSVQDRRRRPIVGLNERNFLVAEQGRPAQNQRLLGAGDRSENLAISVLLDRSPQASRTAAAVAASVRELATEGQGLVRLVSAGDQPVLERMSSRVELERSIIGTPASYSQTWKFDLGLRLAATELFDKAPKRAVVFMSSGPLGDRAFDRYSLSELAAYLVNNSVLFIAVMSPDAPIDPAIRFLCEQSGGFIVSLFENEGWKPTLLRIRNRPVGTYSLQYTSTLPTNFGRAYLPVSVETYLMDRSGRDETGYFAPVE